MSLGEPSRCREGTSGEKKLLNKGPSLRREMVICWQKGSGQFGIYTLPAVDQRGVTKR